MTPPKRLNILLADDGSQHAQSAVGLLQDIPLPPKSRIFVLRAFSPGQVDHLPGFERALDRTKGQLEGCGFKVETLLKLGYPSEEILAATEAKKYDLIVMGAKGLRGTLGILLGGVAQQVVEYADCPVLVVRAPYEGLLRILLVTDGSPYSLHAARYLIRFPLPPKAEIRVMHVMPPIPHPLMMEPYFGGWQTIYPAVSEEEETNLTKLQTHKGEALLARTTGLLTRHGLNPTPVLAHGDAATEILDYVKSNQINLIVAGSRGLSQLSSILMGSVSRKLVHYSPCSVLIVKGPKKKE